ncbi:hypothetical protein [Sphingomonas koreensis]|uniref:hypothetical protein n=1 Tax=Sphingomonas koreensis TaxID=93064 RepID=UPI000F7DC9E2|nr:hypothetical protein [Sphingomonas koreensis]
MFMRDSLQAPGQLPFLPACKGRAHGWAAATGKTGKNHCRPRQHLAALFAFPGNPDDFSPEPGNWHAHC